MPALGNLGNIAQQPSVKTFSMGNEVPNTFSKFFPQETPYRLNKSRKYGFGGTFPLISMVLLGRLFPKMIEFTYGWTRPNHVSFMKIGSKL